MRKTTNRYNIAIGVIARVLVFVICESVSADELPVLVPDFPERQGPIRNPFTYKAMHTIAKSGDHRGLFIDLGNTNLQGMIHTGPYPFEAGEADYDHARYRNSNPLINGAGLLQIDTFFLEKYNINDWTYNQTASKANTTIAYRLEINDHGFYDSRVSFNGNPQIGFKKNLTIIQGPFVNLVRSDEPDKALIVFETNTVCRGQVALSIPFPGNKTPGIQFSPNVYFLEKKPGMRHEIRLSGLQSGRIYQYTVRCEKKDGESAQSAVYTMHTAPKAGKGNITFAFISDSREGVGGGERNYMGHNLHSLSRLVNHAYRKGADFFICGGDLVNGYTSSVDDFRLQLRGWKQSMAGFWRSRPVYTAMGNHETLLNVFDDGSRYGIALDKWPYQTSSAEAIFAEQFWNPQNGPLPSDRRRPSYRENVYHFQFGPVLFIAFNNNYWWSTNHLCKKYGGSPEGYLLMDQLSWIENTLQKAEGDRRVKFVILFAQEPVFPAGGHVMDAMWWNGSNTVKAYEYNGSEVVPAGGGILDVRNRFWKAIARSKKVAAVLTGDEHAYHRIRIDHLTPVGLPELDDLNGDGILDRYSPNPEFTYPTWHITAGAAGAPFHARQEVPWTDSIKFFSSQTGYCLLKVRGRKISMTYYTITGQALDHIENLMAIKK
jgi:hypothetical protein